MNGINSWGERPFTLNPQTHESRVMALKGRTRWALERPMEAGAAGCTPIDTPGPRWSAYVHDLRGLGVRIDTVNEQHGGPFSGRHARYVLRSAVAASEGMK